MKTSIGITVRAAKPRNPFVAAANFRKAGSHSPTQADMRRQAKRELQREVRQLDKPPSP